MQVDRFTKKSVEAINDLQKIAMTSAIRRSSRNICSTRCCTRTAV